MATNWDGTLSGGTYETFTDNLYESSSADNFTGTWDTAIVFVNYGAGDFHMEQQLGFPSLAQADDIASMEGCLSAGDVNEVGAYGNGGYPPNFDE